MLCKTVSSVSNSTTFKLAASTFDKVNSSFIGKNIVESSVETLISTASALVKDEKLSFDKVATNFISNLVTNSIFNSIGITKNTSVKDDVVEDGIDDIFENGRVTKESITGNLSSFSGKSCDEIADVLRNQGYDVTVRNSTKSSSGAQIIQIGNTGNGRNITQVQVSPGGGRHGLSPYIKISTSDQGIFKIVN